MASFCEEKIYLKKGGISNVKHRQSDSPCWHDLIKIRDFYLAGRKMRICNGELTDFWHDAWCLDSPLKDRFPDLFDICQNQKITVADMAKKRVESLF